MVKETFGAQVVTVKTTQMLKESVPAGSEGIVQVMSEPPQMVPKPALPSVQVMKVGDGGVPPPENVTDELNPASPVNPTAPRWTVVPGTPEVGLTLPAGEKSGKVASATNGRLDPARGRAPSVSGAFGAGEPDGVDPSVGTAVSVGVAEIVGVGDDVRAGIGEGVSVGTSVGETVEVGERRGVVDGVGEIVGVGVRVILRMTVRVGVVVGLVAVFAVDETVGLAPWLGFADGVGVELAPGPGDAVEVLVAATVEVAVGVESGGAGCRIGFGAGARGTAGAGRSLAGTGPAPSAEGRGDPRIARNARVMASVTIAARRAGDGRLSPRDIMSRPLDRLI